MDPLSERLAKALQKALTIGAVYLPIELETECREALQYYYAQKGLRGPAGEGYDSTHLEDIDEAL
jgi:hypothetical protein